MGEVQSRIGPEWVHEAIPADMGSQFTAANNHGTYQGVKLTRANIKGGNQGQKLTITPDSRFAMEQFTECDGLNFGPMITDGYDAPYEGKLEFQPEPSLCPGAQSVTLHIESLGGNAMSLSLPCTFLFDQTRGQLQVKYMQPSEIMDGGQPTLPCHMVHQQDYDRLDLYEEESGFTGFMSQEQQCLGEDLDRVANEMEKHCPSAVRLPEGLEHCRGQL